MSSKKVNNTSKEFLFYVAVLITLILTSININIFLGPKTVLGLQTDENVKEKFWQDFTSKNPNYIPALIETGQIEKVRQIDPNYIIP